MEGDTVNDLVKPFAWILGNWVSASASGSFPNIKDFVYNENLDFQTRGKQPVLAYSGSSSNPQNGNPMHLETGFLRGRPGNCLTFMVAHNFGLATVEEGNVAGKIISLSTKSIGRMTGAADPEVLKIERKFTLQDDDILVQEVFYGYNKSS